MDGKISIIIPVFNVENYLNRCIDSVIHQTYKNLEVILIDDGSTDKSGDICEEYAKKDNRIIVLHKNNGGVSDTRNSGLSMATGKYIGFVDSDDYIENDMYETLLNILNEQSADIVECCYRQVGDDCTINEDMNSNSLVSIEHFDTVSALKELILSRKFTRIVWNKLYKREVLNKLLFPVNRAHEEEFWVYKVFSNAKKIVYCSAIKYYYFQHMNSFTKSYDYLARIDRFYAYVERLDFIKNNYNSLYNFTQRKLFFFLVGKYKFLAQNKNLDVNRNYRNKILNYIHENFKSFYSNPLMKNDRKLLILFNLNSKIIESLFTIKFFLRPVKKNFK